MSVNSCINIWAWDDILYINIKSQVYEETYARQWAKLSLKHSSRRTISFPTSSFNVTVGAYLFKTNWKSNWSSKKYVPLIPWEIRYQKLRDWCSCYITYPIPSCLTLLLQLVPINTLFKFLLVGNSRLLLCCGEKEASWSVECGEPTIPNTDVLNVVQDSILRSIYRCLDVQVCLSTVGHPSQIQEQTSGKWKPKIFNQRVPLAHTSTPRYSANFYLKHRFTAFGLVAIKSCKHVFVMLLRDLCKLPAPSPLRKLPSAFVTRCRALCPNSRAWFWHKCFVLGLQFLSTCMTGASSYAGTYSIEHIWDSQLLSFKRLFTKPSSCSTLSSHNGLTTGYRSWLKQYAMERCITPESTPLPCGFKYYLFLIDGGNTTSRNSCVSQSEYEKTNFVLGRGTWPSSGEMSTSDAWPL